MSTRTDLRRLIGPGGATLTSPERNRYYYGKLLDAFHFELEQEYSSGKRELLNRLSVGSGVLCGLRVGPTADRTRIRVSAGVALDGLGREIIVPTDSPPVDPRQPTDDCGRPAGDPLLQGGTVTVFLCYHECPRDPAPVMVDACGPEERCEFGIIEERYRIQIRAGMTGPAPDLVDARSCRRLFGQQPQKTLAKLEDVRKAMEGGRWTKFVEGVNELRLRSGMEIVADPGDLAARKELFDAERERTLRSSRRRALLCELFGGQCPTPRDPCVPLAVVRLDPRGRVLGVDNCSVRRTLYSNAFLLDLILCLAERVDACCAEPTVKVLSMVSGDQQVGAVSQVLADPLVVKVSEGSAAVANELVIFEALGDGAIGADAANLQTTFATNTKADGTAELPAWKLGAAPGRHMVSARINQGSPMLVTFRATARMVKPDLPVVRAVWPPNATALAAGGGLAAEWNLQFGRRPRVQLTFDRRMAEDQLNNPDSWMGFYAIRARRDGLGVLRVPLTRQQTPENSLLGEAGVTETFLLVMKGTDELEESGTMVRMMVRPALALADRAGFMVALDRPAIEPPPDDVGLTVVPTTAVRFLVLVRAAADNINAADAPQGLLDADFAGTTVPSATLQELHQMAPGASKVFGASLWDELVDIPSAVLPQSGDGQAGGWFHSWFELFRAQ